MVVFRYAVLTEVDRREQRAFVFLPGFWRSKAGSWRNFFFVRLLEVPGGRLSMAAVLWYAARS